eukprot:scaffold667_cov262-Pinguiococcus_pyrenoidosus.AAC.4
MSPSLSAERPSSSPAECPASISGSFSKFAVLRPLSYTGARTESPSHHTAHHITSHVTRPTSHARRPELELRDSTPTVDNDTMRGERPHPPRETPQKHTRDTSIPARCPCPQTMTILNVTEVQKSILKMAPMVVPSDAGFAPFAIGDFCFRDVGVLCSAELRVFRAISVRRILPSSRRSAAHSFRSQSSSSFSPSAGPPSPVDMVGIAASAAATAAAV